MAQRTQTPGPACPPPRWRDGWARAAALVCFLAALDLTLLQSRLPWYVAQLRSDLGLARAAAALCLYLSLLGALVALLALPRLRWAVLAAMLASALLNFAYRRINGDDFGLGDVHSVVASWALGPAVVGAHAATVAASAAWVSGLLGLPLGAWLRRRPLRLAGRWALCALLPLIAGLVLMPRANGTHLYAFPNYIKPLYMGAAYLWHRGSGGPRRPPRFTPTDPPLARHVIFLLDESVRGDVLGVNGGLYV